MRVQRPTSRPVRSRSGADRRWKVWLTRLGPRRGGSARGAAASMRWRTLEAALEPGSVARSSPSSSRRWIERPVSGSDSGGGAILALYGAGARPRTEGVSVGAARSRRAARTGAGAGAPLETGGDSRPRSLHRWGLRHGGRGALAAAREPPRRARTRVGPAPREPARHAEELYEGAYSAAEGSSSPSHRLPRSRALPPGRVTGYAPRFLLAAIRRCGTVPASVRDAIPLPDRRRQRLLPRGGVPPFSDVRGSCSSASPRTCRRRSSGAGGAARGRAGGHLARVGERLRGRAPDASRRRSEAERGPRSRRCAEEFRRLD